MEPGCAPKIFMYRESGGKQLRGIPCLRSLQDVKEDLRITGEDRGQLQVLNSP